MINVAIVEDNIRYTNEIKGYLSKFSKEYDVNFKIHCFSDGDQISKDYKPIYDIILMDIEMKFLNGMETAKHIRIFDSDVIIIFITNMMNYAVKGYEVSALSYLLKPVPYFAFSQEIKRSIEEVNKRNKHYLMITTKEGIIRLDITEILYFESNKHRVLINTYDNQYSMVSSIRDVETKLKGESFYRCNSGIIINLEYVDEVKGSDVYIQGNVLPISRPRKKGFMNALTNFIGGSIK